MKNFKKIAALLVSALLILAMMAPAFADDPAYDAKVSVTALEEGDVAHFYKVVEWVGETDDNVSGWKAVAPFNTILTKDVLTKVLVGTKQATQEDVDAKKATKVGQLIDPTGINGYISEAASIAIGRTLA